MLFKQKNINIPIHIIKKSILKHTSKTYTIRFKRKVASSSSANKI